MKKTLLLLLLIAVPAVAQDAPRTGFFKVTTTPMELLGERGAAAVASMFAADQELMWQLYVPETYDATKPAGVMVMLNYADHWNAGKKAWNPVSDARNLIWIGALGAGDKKPANERIMRTILAQAVLERDYAIDHSRYYLFGYSGGARVAAMLATAKPETFKGAWFYGDAMFWGEREPARIDLIRQNRYFFGSGARDKHRKDILRTSDAYRKAGVENVTFATEPNIDRKMPGVSYFESVVEFLDARSSSESDSK